MGSYTTGWESGTVEGWTTLNGTTGVNVTSASPIAGTWSFFAGTTSGSAVVCGAYRPGTTGPATAVGTWLEGSIVVRPTIACNLAFFMQLVDAVPTHLEHVGDSGTVVACPSGVDTTLSARGFVTVAGGTQYQLIVQSNAEFNVPDQIKMDTVNFNDTGNPPLVEPLLGAATRLRLARQNSLRM
jgi:hypothetical protein